MNAGMHREKFRDRRQFIGGSDARIIMSGDEAALIRLWKEKRGEAEPEDFSNNLVVQLGIAAGALAILWGAFKARSTAPAARRCIPASVCRPRVGLRRRTPTPPPFSAMNSTPPDSRHHFTTSSVARRD